MILGQFVACMFTLKGMAVSCRVGFGHIENSHVLRPEMFERRMPDVSPIHTIHLGVGRSEKIIPFVCSSALAQACADLQDLRLDATFEDASAAEDLKFKCFKEQPVCG